MFRFKQFNVDQTGCAMKINTDGVLLGAIANADQPKTILDIGTGTGVIALMLAQRFPDAKIDAVEIDETAAATAKLNFEGSPFVERLNLFTMGFEDHLQQQPERKYDMIVSNPPFYINSLESPGEKKNLAKHTDADFFEELIKAIRQQLSDSGTCWLVLPLQTAHLVKAIATHNQLQLQKTISIKSYPDSIPHREIIVLTLNQVREEDEEFFIYNEPKVYSFQYQDLLTPFFTIF